MANNCKKLKIEKLELGISNMKKEMTEKFESEEIALREEYEHRIHTSETLSRKRIGELEH